MVTLEQVRQELKPVETLREILGPYMHQAPKCNLTSKDVINLMCQNSDPIIMAKLIALYNEL